jgi:hypothetical protein
VRSAAGAFLLFLATAGSGLAAGPALPPADYGAVSASDRASGQAALDEFRQAVPDQVYYEFQLELRPRRGDTHSVPGRLWAGHNEAGPVMRLILDPGALDERRWLIQAGPRPAAWRSEGAAPAQSAGLFEPLFPGMGVTAFDLLPIYLSWPDETLLSVSRLSSRPAYKFLFRPPAAFAAQHPEIAGMRVYLDTQYKAPARTELLASDHVLKTMAVNKVKPMGEHPAVVKQVDLRDEVTRDTTRFDVNAAAVGLDLLPALFTPAELGTDLAPPGQDRLVRF